MEIMILHEIFRVVSRFPRYISCYCISRKIDFLWDSILVLNKSQNNLLIHASAIHIICMDNDPIYTLQHTWRPVKSSLIQYSTCRTSLPQRLPGGCRWQRGPCSTAPEAWPPSQVLGCKILSRYLHETHQTHHERTTLRNYSTPNVSVV